MLIWAEIVVEIKHKNVMFRDKIYFIHIQFGETNKIIQKYCTINLERPKKVFFGCKEGKEI